VAVFLRPFYRLAECEKLVIRLGSWGFEHPPDCPPSKPQAQKAKKIQLRKQEIAKGVLIE
jgi:hypothetical protein